MLNAAALPAGRRVGSSSTVLVWVTAHALGPSLSGQGPWQGFEVGEGPSTVALQL